jgi:hypothetical protein
MDRLRMPSAMPAELAERLSDVADSRLEFDPWLLEDCEACFPHDKDLAFAISCVLQCKHSPLEQFLEARDRLEKAMGRRFADL